MRTEEFDYDLPRELIAQTPLPIRHESRLLVFRRATGEIIHSKFCEVSKFLGMGDLFVVNKTRVIPARLLGQKPTGGKAEALLLKRIDATRWEALVGGKGLGKGKEISFPFSIHAVILAEMGGSKRILQFNQPIDDKLNEIGEMPLPPYIHERLRDPERYQTVFAQETGSAAAPTAGLHFTQETLHDLQARGMELAEITLHVGLDTFAPVTEENVEEHVIHSEWCELDERNAEKINLTKKAGKAVVAVGTTSVRTAESAAADGLVNPYSGSTNLFIYPGYQFQVVDAMITNFHLPKSTLLMLVSAFMGKENVMKCYQAAIREKYRFYSFGDAMLII